MAAPDRRQAVSSVARIQPSIRAPCVLGWRRPGRAISWPTFREGALGDVAHGRALDQLDRLLLEPRALRRADRTNERVEVALDDPARNRALDDRPRDRVGHRAKRAQRLGTLA